MPTPSSQWFADESFWEAVYPFVFPPWRRGAADHEADAILAMIGRPPGTLLDLCCGPGRHSVAFARRGAVVTGVDLSPFLLERAREHAAAEQVGVEWVRADMREFVRPAAFDTAVNLFTSFGYFDEDRENALVIANVFASLKPGGAMVLDVAGKEIVARIFQGCGTLEAEGERLLVERRWVVDDWCRVENEWHVIDKGVARSFRFRHWVYSGRELGQLLVSAGFDRIELFGNFERGAYGLDAQRLIAVARKPEHRSSA